MDFSICHDCVEPNAWGGAILLTLFIAAAIALGYLASRISARYRQVLLGTVLTCAVTVVLGISVWIGTGSFWAVLPFLALFIGLFHRRAPVPSVLSRRG